jgi:predicted esterase
VRDKLGILFDPTGHAPGLIVYLHGMGASPEDSCSFFESAARNADSVLLCPRGPAGPKAWIGSMKEKRAVVDEALGKISPRLTGTLIGFSIGARFALELAMAEPGKWPGLILMSQNLALTPAMLDAAGVRRVVLAAGELDGTFAALKSEAAKLGERARFVSLGKVGHHFAVDMDTRMAEAVAWVMGS